MEVNTTLKDCVLEKKLDRYCAEKNFVATSELTVTITLEEYRDLIKEVATKEHDIEKANKDKWERDSENRRLKEECEMLRKELYDAKSCVKREGDGTINYGSED